MIETIKFISSSEIENAKSYNTSVTKYLYENKINFLDVLEFDNSIRIELSARNVKYEDVIFISGEEILKLLEFTGMKTFYFTPTNQEEFSIDGEAKGIVLVLKK